MICVTFAAVSAERVIDGPCPAGMLLVMQAMR